MRVLVLAVVLAGCVPPVLVSRARMRLGTSQRHLTVDHTRIGNDDIYTFCRGEGSTDLGSPLPWIRARSFNAACVIYDCPPGQSSGCRESMM